MQPDLRTSKSCAVLFLESDYIQIPVIPELGRRIWSAMDKVNGYDFFHHQHVVKPALVGMLGAWISGVREARSSLYNLPRRRIFSP